MEKKEPRREKGEKALWGEEGAGKSRRGRRGRRGRGEALRGRGTTREDCMAEVNMAALPKISEDAVVALASCSSSCQVFTGLAPRLD